LNEIIEMESDMVRSDSTINKKLVYLDGI